MNWFDEVKKYLGLLITTEVTEIKYLERISRDCGHFTDRFKKYAKLRIIKRSSKIK